MGNKTDIIVNNMYFHVRTTPELSLKMWEHAGGLQMSLNIKNSSKQDQGDHSWSFYLDFDFEDIVIMFSFEDISVLMKF